METIIAGIIFSVVAVLLMGVWDMQFKAMLKSKETAVASFLAERIMEECVAAGFDRVELLYPDPVELEVRTRTKAGVKTTNYETVVDTSVTHPDSKQKVVIVRVTFHDNGGDHNVEFHTTLHESG